MVAIPYNLIMFSRHNVRMTQGWPGALALVLVLLIALSACQNGTPSAPEAAAPAAAEGADPVTAVPDAPLVETTSPTATAVPPTPTLEPLAALVNDVPITLADYEKELSRYEQAHLELGQEPSSNYRATVLEALIDRQLITQAAAAAGLLVTPEMVDEKLAELRSTANGEDNFDAWLEANQWSEEEFRQALEAEMVTAQMRDVVTAEVPYAVEQIRARYLQVDDAVLASSLLDQIRSGADFGLLAQQYSRDTATAPAGGELGFFARGSLLVPELEEAAMALQPGEVSDVITVAGATGGQTFYLIQVLERDPQRPLSANMRYTLLTQTFETWLENQRSQANITRFVNTDA